MVRCCILFLCSLLLLASVVILVKCEGSDRLSQGMAVPDFPFPIGWSFEELPLGETEVSASLVKQTLRADYYSYRRFSCGDVWFSLFIATWGSGKQDPREVQGHTPDVCWTSAGWTTLTRGKSDFLAPSREGHFGETRKFVSPAGTVVWCDFWHWIEGRTDGFGDLHSRRYSSFRAMYDWLLYNVLSRRSGNERQVFVRIASNIDPHTLRGRRDTHDFLASLARFLQRDLNKTVSRSSN